MNFKPANILGALSAHNAPISEANRAGGPASLRNASEKNATGNGLLPKHTGLLTSTVPELRKLAEYEQICGGAVASKVSVFMPTPSTTSQAQSGALVVAGTLRAFAQAGVAPVVFLEPTDADGTPLDLKRYASGSYDSVLEEYFGALLSAGITSNQMGNWVFLPEGNLPVWSTVDPAVYARVVARTASIMKQRFPESQAALMLDSQSFPVGGSWGQGEYVSLLPYVRQIPKGLIDSFGLQGFPWAGPADQPADTLYDPEDYLRTDFAVEAARSLGVGTIWFNTGTFGRMYANQTGAAVSLSAAQRKAILERVVRQSIHVKEQGFAVAIHLFAQNKADLSEGTDWSYWHALSDEGTDAAIFSSFALQATSAGLDIWLYDTAGN